MPSVKLSKSEALNRFPDQANYLASFGMGLKFKIEWATTIYDSFYYPSNCRLIATSQGKRYDGGVIATIPEIIPEVQAFYAKIDKPIVRPKIWEGCRIKESGRPAFVRQVREGYDDQDHGTVEIEYLDDGSIEHFVYYGWENSLVLD